MPFGIAETRPFILKALFKRIALSRRVVTDWPRGLDEGPLVY